VWRFRAAPEERLMMTEDGVESAWPVHGSVLVRDGLAWFAAGRSAYLDGGIRLYALNVASGEPVIEKRLDGRDPSCWTLAGDGGRRGGNRMNGTLPDILSASDERIFMGWACFDSQGRLAADTEPHLFSATGFLDDTWWHRTYWQYGTWMRGGFGGWPQAARAVPAGRLLVDAGDALFGFGREKYDVGNPAGVHAGHVGVIKDGYQESGRVDHAQNPMRLFCCVKPTGGAGRGKPGPIEFRWQKPVPMVVRGMVLANDTLLIAGPDAGQDRRGLALLGTPQPGRLWSVSAADSQKQAECKLTAAPVLDGMAAAAGRLYMATTDGSVVCFGK
jgi:hypothetical protein